MIEPRPDKYRGASVYGDFALVALNFGALLYLPPASGAVVSMVDASQTAVVAVMPSNLLPVFTNGATVNSLIVAPTWGTDYALTGQVFAGSTGGGLTGWHCSNVPSFSINRFVVFPPNVFMIQNSAAVGCLQQFLVEEFPSAEELNRWRSAPA